MEWVSFMEMKGGIEYPESLVSPMGLCFAHGKKSFAIVSPIFFFFFDSYIQLVFP